jgi:hypothetical protein
MLDDRAVKDLVRRWMPGAVPLLKQVRDQASGFSVIHAARFALQPRKRVFSLIYRQNRWGSEESASGPGSTLYATTRVRAELPGLLARHGVQSMLDAPCGDFRWMREVDLGISCYMGADIVAEMIEHLQARYGASEREFLVRDITRHDLPCADLVFCRDCLVHLSHEDVWAAIQRFRDSGSTYLLTTTYPETDRNPNIFSGHWRPLNLQLPPFSFPEPLEMLNEGPYDLMDDGTPYRPDKSLGLWRLDALPKPPLRRV